MTSVVLLISTFPNADAARTATRTLVDEKAVACGNVIPGLESIYRWQGKVETNLEVLVIFKTTAERADAAIERIAELHPYEVPEVLRIPTDGGWQPYLDWVKDSVAG